MPTLPHTASKSHGAFEPGYSRLDSGSEPSKAMIHIFTAAHIGFFKTTLFGKADIFDITRSSLGFFQIVFRCKPAIKTDLERITAIDFFLPIQHRDGQIHIGRIAFDNHAIQDQVRSPAGQTDLVPEIVSRRSLTIMSVCGSKMDTTLSAAATLWPSTTRRWVWSMTFSVS